MIDPRSKIKGGNGAVGIITRDCDEIKLLKGYDLPYPFRFFAFHLSVLYISCSYSLLATSALREVLAEYHFQPEKQVDGEE